MFQWPDGLLSKGRCCKVIHRFIKCLLVACAAYRRISNMAPAYLFFLRKFYLFIFGCVGSVAVRGLSLVAASGGCSSLRGLLIAVASLSVEHGL